MSDENRLSFSSNGSGISLNTRYGSLNFTSEEFNYYEYIFKIADNLNLGKLLVGSSQLNSLLVRTNFSNEVIESALSIVLNDTGESKGVSFPHWLMLCKLLAYYQETNRTLTDQSLKKLHKTSVKIPLLNFHLNSLSKNFSSGDYFELYRCEVKGWQLWGESYPQQHVRFKIETKSELVDETNLRHLKLSVNKKNRKPNEKELQDEKVDELRDTNVVENGNKKKKKRNSKSNPPSNVREPSTSDSLSPLPSPDISPSDTNGSIVEIYSCDRRYSEFESFVEILQANYKGLIIPPLPIKHWAIIPSHEQLGMERSKEFQLFLDDMVSHPLLRYSYELKTFLECSSPAFKNFIDLYYNLHYNAGKGRVEFDNKSKHGHTGSLETLSKLLNESAQFVSNNKPVEFMSQLWGTVTRNFSQLSRTTGEGNASSSPHSNGSSENNDTEKNYFENISKYIESLSNIGKKFESVHRLETDFFNDLAHLALSMKEMSDYETIPELVNVLQKTNRHLSSLSAKQKKSLQHNYMQIVIPVLYISRYFDSFKVSLAQRSEAIEFKQKSLRNEIVAKQNYEMNLAMTGQNSYNSQPESEKSPNLEHLKKLWMESEDASEISKQEEEKISSHLKVESERVQFLQKQNLLKYLSSFAKSQLEACRANQSLWQDLKESLEQN